GRTALVLLPEVARVEASQGVFLSRWGHRCQVYHGGLPPGARRKAWVRIQQGDASVVVGTRSAVFAPLAHLGLIVVDQEDHPAYKAENMPRYDARAVADERARRAGAVLGLASAHPSLDTVHAGGSDVLAPRATSERVPPVTVWALRDAPCGSILSPPLPRPIAAWPGSRQVGHPYCVAGRTAQHPDRYPTGCHTVSPTGRLPGGPGPSRCRVAPAGLPGGRTGVPHAA